jgi:flagella basal body P-ring formation protein FlgA
MKKFITLFLICFCFNINAAEVFQTEKDCVKLSDILSVSSEREIICGLNYGETIKISKSRIANLLSREKIKYNNFKLTDINIKRTGVKLSNQIIKNKIIEVYKKNFPNTKFTVNKIKILRDIYAKDKDSFKLAIKNLKFGSSYGIIDNGVKKERVYFIIEAFKKIYVTTNKIYKGQELNDITLKEMNVTKLRFTPIENPSLFIAKRNIAPNKPLTMEYVIKKPINFKGDIVEIIYKSKNIYIETKGVLENNAYLNERVKVKNIDSGKSVYARAVRQDKYMVVN